jgi:ABC-type phosphate transport system substrate-binding protein
MRCPLTSTFPLGCQDPRVPCMSHASCEEVARPSPADAPVQLYDIKWPSVRSSFVQLPFTYAAYQWARAGKTLLTAWRSKTGEATVSLDAGKAQPFGRSRAGKSAMAVSVAAAAVVALTACGSSPGSRPPDVTQADASSSSAPAGASRTLAETGSSLMAPLFALWAPAYHARFSQVTLRTTSSSSGEGISSAAAGKADIGASDAFLSPATLAKYSSLVNIPLAVAALMVVYNVPGISGPAHLRLNGTVLARIFSGKIGRWDDPAIAALNPGVTLPGAAIVPVHRADSSGSTFLFTSYLNAQDPSGWSSSLIGTSVAWPRPPGALGASGSDAIVSSCRRPSSPCPMRRSPRSEAETEI